MIKRFRIVPFVIGLILGYGLLHYYVVDKPVVYEYPHPSTKKIYKHRNGSCYSYSATEVDCDANEGRLKAYPG
jgi:hypothetical protein